MGPECVDFTSAVSEGCSMLLVANMSMRYE